MIKNVEDLINHIKNNDGYRFKIKVIANASKNMIDFYEDFIKVKIMAPATDGKANKAIIDFLSKTLKFPKSKIKIVTGEKSSMKEILIQL